MKKVKPGKKPTSGPTQLFRSTFEFRFFIAVFLFLLLKALLMNNEKKSNYCA